MILERTKIYSQFTIHNSQFTIHNSQFTIHNSQFTMDLTLPKNYLDLFNYFYYAIHPAVFIFGIWGIWLFRNRLFKKKLFRFLAILLVFDFLLKNLKFWHTGMLTERYVLILIVIANIFIAIACLYSGRLIGIGELFKKNKKVKQVWICLVSIAVVIMIGQNFKAAFNKPWLRGVGEQIKGNNTPPSQVVILTNYDDPRLGFYANADTLMLNLSNFIIHNYNKFNSNEYDIIHCSGIRGFINNLNNFHSCDIYLFLYKKNPDSLKKRFKVEGFKFPFKLVREFNYKKKSYLYKYNSVNDF